MDNTSDARNVLLMVADDLGKQLGCYGAETIRTPNIDRLAAQGTRFENAFASTASCSGSRSVIYTGLHTHQNGQYGLASHRHHFVTFDHVETAPQLLNLIGHRTGIIGKVHVGPSSVYPWEVNQESDTRDVAVIADQAKDFFQRTKHDSKPFFLTIGFVDPHRDRTRGGFGNDQNFDSRVNKSDYDKNCVEIPTFINDTPGTRLELAEYYNSIHRLDQGVGFILDALADSDLSRSTLVIFLSDNGPPFLNSKTTLFDAGVQLPLIIRHPERQPTVNDMLVSYIDILPTVLDFVHHPAAIDSAGKRLGSSLLPILGTSATLSRPDEVFGSHTFHEVTNYWPTRFIRTRRYKYHRNIAWRLDFPFAADIYGSLSWDDIRNSTEEIITIGQRKLKDYFFRRPEELFDLHADPHEINNLVDDAGHQALLKELRGKLEHWQRRTEDPWLYRDGVSIWFNRYHFPAGLKIPNHLDLDVCHPGNTEPDSYPVSLPWGTDLR
ncbi:Alkaline phosphatase-like alpha/beta/alpha [Penicillium macrosclerotiorum]|uniref:Alkaline phosphatase-like alpha/beta/alpha n=1 Tax=Penicillium macrosclerotiorum TaxID=303699 RepID=UPI00254861F0|nr:Alkaline phosphatase-like alpha/beta/alpha [Penicillium macrosclerotiorum]KAJ5688515.1 Alkaline phosphatase-like alpha/beta/alpha [Penicillium macrosclerotiorum]